MNALEAHAQAELAWSLHKPNCKHTTPPELCPIRLLRNIAYARYTRSNQPITLS